MITTRKKLIPAIAIHPGEMLKDELDAINLSQKEFATLIGLPATQLNEIIKGKRGIYADLALLIEKVLKIDASVWLNMQMNYELNVAKINEKNKTRIEAINLWQMIKNLVPTTFLKN
jgi:HTH-type transcriptional regulator/antitoxin HigA